MEALAKLADEDATFHYIEDEDTGELIMRGMGELHLEIIADRLRRGFNVPVRVGQPEVPHRETISATGRAAASPILLQPLMGALIIGKLKHCL